ncbi:MAG: hypothetical protein JXR60_11540 [Bacteroidales bacterium]|nr:hypothetical protein [Bacteroidales bacterium]
MEILIDKSFRKKLLKTNNKKLYQSVLSVINEIKSVDDINVVEFSTFDHRGNIYKNFP